MQNHEKDQIDDIDLDKEWKPNNRPQSTMARNFSAALDDLFRMDDSLDNLSKNVFEKKQAVSTQSQELDALEARLKETEERLKKAGQAPFTRHDSQRRTPVRGTFEEAEQAKSSNAPHSDEGSADEASRHHPAHETPTTSLPQAANPQSGPEYVMVDRPRAQ